MLTPPCFEAEQKQSFWSLIAEPQKHCRDLHVSPAFLHLYVHTVFLRPRVDASRGLLLAHWLSSKSCVISFLLFFFFFSLFFFWYFKAGSSGNGWNCYISVLVKEINANPITGSYHLSQNSQLKEKKHCDVKVRKKKKGLGGGGALHSLSNSDWFYFFLFLSLFLIIFSYVNRDPTTKHLCSKDISVWFKTTWVRDWALI